MIAQKIIFRVHGCNVQGTVMVSKSVRHQELPAFVAKPAPCLVGDGGHTAHYWGPAEPSAGFLFPMIVTHN